MKIELGRYSTILRRILGATGASDVASELAPEISPVLVLESQRPEWDYLGGTKRCAAARQQPLTALVESSIRFRNPAGSGMIMVFESIVISLSALGDCFINLGPITSDLTTAAKGRATDTRWEADSALITSRDNQPSAFATQGLWRGYVSTATEVPRKFCPLLSPGFAFEVTSPINTTMNVCAAWEERQLQPLERAANL